MTDTYRPPPRNGGGRRHINDDPPYRAHSPPRRDNDSGYSFRGAAGGDSYRPPADFTFNAPGSQTRFPDVQPPPRKRPAAKGYNERQKKRPQQGGRPPWQNRPFKPRAAHDRAILKHVDDDTTTEQMIGLNGDQPKFAEYISSSEDDSDSDSSSDEDEGEGQSRKKRAKTNKADGDEKPKWSNPDPYSVLPPPDAVAGPKKDIVQTIRKAKVEASAPATSTNAVKENADFISFDFGDGADDDEEEEDDDMHSVGEPPAPASTEYDHVMPTEQELMDRLISTQKGNKRKRGNEEFTGVGDIVEEWLPNHTNPTPWLQPDAHFTSSVGLKLHKEILDFYDYVRPHRHEEELREEIIDRLQRDLQYHRQPGPPVNRIEVRSFGSFPAGLYLPTADMDLVALSPDFLDYGRKMLCQNRKHMWKMHDHFTHGRVAAPGSVVPVIGARVPLVKFVDAHTGIKVDLSFENDSGLHANATFQRWKKDFPEMPVLVMIIKQLLAMRGLNEVHTGGIGGFTIICLVVSMLQLMPESVRNGMDFNARYGELLLNFLDLYGNKFSLTNTGIQMEPAGYFDKKDRPDIPKAKAGRLMIIDPNNSTNDISGGSSNVAQVFALFSRARAAIQRRLNQVRGGGADDASILECVLGGNYTSFREQRERLDRIDRQYAARDQPPPQTYRQPPPAQQYYNDMHNRATSPRRGQTYDRSHNQYSFQPPPQQYPQYQQYPPPHDLPSRPAPAPYRAPEPTNNGPVSKKQKKSKPKPKKVKPVEAGPSSSKEKKQKTKSKKKSNKKESNKKNGKKAAKNAR